MIATSHTGADSYAAKSTKKIDLGMFVDAIEHYEFTGEISPILKGASFPKGYQIAQFEDSEGVISLVSEGMTEYAGIVKGDRVGMSDDWMNRFHKKWVEKFAPKSDAVAKEEQRYVSIAEIKAKAQRGDDYMDSDDKDTMFA